jgi:hypothetical protein
VTQHGNRKSAQHSVTFTSVLLPFLLCSRFSHIWLTMKRMYIQFITCSLFCYYLRLFALLHSISSLKLHYFNLMDTLQQGPNVNTLSCRSSSIKRRRRCPFSLLIDEKSLLDSNVPPDTILMSHFLRFEGGRWLDHFAGPLKAWPACLQVNCTRKSMGTPTRAYTAGTNRCRSMCVWVPVPAGTVSSAASK